MIFDPDLMRQILLAVEAFPEPYSEEPLEIDGHSQTEISYHIKLLHDAGLLKALDAETFQLGILWLPQHLTYEGHNFLAAIKEDTAWNKVKSLVVAGGKQASIAALMQTAKEFVKGLF